MAKWEIIVIDGGRVWTWAESEEDARANVSELLSLGPGQILQINEVEDDLGIDSWK